MAIQLCLIKIVEQYFGEDDPPISSILNMFDEKNLTGKEHKPMLLCFDKKLKSQKSRNE